LIDWSTFFAAQLGASAALAGLLFVGISINMTKILSFPILPNRALQSLILLGNILIASSLQLVPEQPVAFLGAEVLALGCVVWGASTLLSVRNLRIVYRQYRSSTIFEIVVNQLAVLSYVAAGIVMLFFGLDGVYLLVPAILVSYLNVLIDAWVLLVEINR
jgi:hypothetical protein